MGLTSASYACVMALVCSLIIAGVTYFLCLGRFSIGKTVGNRFSGKAEVLGRHFDLYRAGDFYPRRLLTPAYCFPQCRLTVSTWSQISRLSANRS
ncbi:MAG: manganese efflux pump MntP family protein [Oscillospiraceae bacterium]|nr:manganese efflux pump MntP family protein [Oscillospiraceae bacterium]